MKCIVNYFKLLITTFTVSKLLVIHIKTNIIWGIIQKSKKKSSKKKITYQLI